ncbi:MAG: MMPL family transporter [Thermoplasmata archaeon]
MENTPEEQIQLVSAYHNSFHECWLGSLLSPLTQGTHELQMNPEERAKFCVDYIAPLFFGFNASKTEQNSTEAQFAYDVWKNFGLHNFTNKSIAHSIAINTIANSSGLDADFLEKIYNLGEKPTNETFARFSHSIIQNGTIWTYPVQIPSRYVEKMVSKENDLAMVVFEFSLDSSDDIMKDNVKELRRIVSELKKELNNNGKKLQTYVTGSAAISVDTEAKSITDMLIIEPVTIALIFLFISLFFLSIATPFIPLVNAGIGLLVSQALIFIIGSTFLEIHYLIVFILFAMILAVGSDYSIFIISRYREERVNGKTREEAVRTSLIWAGESIATSGMTVIVGAGALVFMNFSIARMLGIAFMLGVGIALAVNLTFLPSMILVLGNRIFWPSRDKWKAGSKFAEEYKKKKARHEGYFSKSASFSIKHSKAIVLACLLVTVPSVYAISSFEISFDFISLMPKSESKAGMNAMSEGFGAGNIMPTYVVVELPYEIRYEKENTTEYNLTIIETLERLSIELEDVDNVASVSGPSRPNGYALNFSNKNELEQYQTDIDRTIGVDNRTVILTVVLNKEPMEKTSVDTIPKIREKVSSVKSKESMLKDAKILVGGETANMKDLQDMTMKDFAIVVVFVIVGIFIVLLVVLRSIMIPLRLILTILLSISWSLALTMFIFQIILGYPIIWLLPIILFSILMGLGMDYDIFLCTRIREEYLKTKDDERSIVTAVEETGGIITICGAIMVGAVGSLVLSGLGLLQEFGFAIGFAILVDATLVRIYLVPAIMVLLKKWNWWMPGGIQRVKTEEMAERKAENCIDTGLKDNPSDSQNNEMKNLSEVYENKETNK